LRIILDSVEKSPSKQVAVDYIVANDVAIVPLLTQYSFQGLHSGQFPKQEKNFNEQPIEFHD